jgi:hypothetical protein
MRFVASGTMGFVYYRTLKDQQSVNAGGSGRFDVLSGRVRPFAEVNADRSRDRVGHDVDVRVRRMRTGMAAGMDLQLSPITALTAWARRDQVSYDDRALYLGVDLAEQLDSASRLVAGGLKFAVTPLTTIVVAAEYQQNRFATAHVRDADSIRVAPTVEFGTGAIITGRASVGVRQFSPLDGRLPKYRGVVASAGLSHNLMNVTRFDIEALRDVDYAFDPLQPYYVQTGGRLTVSQRIIGPLELVAIGGRQRLEYQAVAGALVEPRVETTRTLGGGVGFRLSEDMRFTLTYDTIDRRSNGPTGRQYERHRVFASMRYLP